MKSWIVNHGTPACRRVLKDWNSGKNIEDLLGLILDDIFARMQKEPKETKTDNDDEEQDGEAQEEEEEEDDEADEEGEADEEDRPPAAAAAAAPVAAAPATGASKSVRKLIFLNIYIYISV